MPTKPLTREQMQEALDLLDKHKGDYTKAGAELGMIASGFRNRVRAARERLGGTGQSDMSSEEIMRNRIKMLEKALADKQKQELNNAVIWKHITEIAEIQASPAKWLTTRKKTAGTLGVPTLFLSDWHWGETVRPSAVEGVNEFNIEIARKRVARLIETADYLLWACFEKPKYDGIVVALGGDMVTGTIHNEESREDTPIMVTLVDLFDVLTGVIEHFASKFDHVHVPCVTGNHGRTTRKPLYKDRSVTNYDWLVYCLLARHFKGRSNITFQVPDAPDAQYRVYDHSYLLTHGDQFRGGDGLIGPLGPITRGRHKKQSRNTSVGRGFDTMILGHFHRLMQLPDMIVNGSLKGYDEYAYGNNLGFEVPAQALWINHPQHGITWQMPIYLNEAESFEQTNWISVAA